MKSPIFAALAIVLVVGAPVVCAQVPTHPGAYEYVTGPTSTATAYLGQLALSDGEVKAGVVGHSRLGGFDLALGECMVGAHTVFGQSLYCEAMKTYFLFHEQVLDASGSGGTSPGVYCSVPGSYPGDEQFCFEEPSNGWNQPGWQYVITPMGTYMDTVWYEPPVGSFCSVPGSYWGEGSYCYLEPSNGWNQPGMQQVFSPDGVLLGTVPYDPQWPYGSLDSRLQTRAILQPTALGQITTTPWGNFSLGVRDENGFCTLYVQPGVLALLGLRDTAAKVTAAEIGDDFVAFPIVMDEVTGESLPPYIWTLD